MTHENLIISEKFSLAKTLQQMDAVRHKLLILVNEDGKYTGLITIGDIQRAIIAGCSLERSVKEFVREDLVIARTSDDEDKIRKQMISLRIEFMPVINEFNEISRVIYWDDIVETPKSTVKQPLNIPVVIMAGGLGTRLRPLTHIIPKPLLPYGNKSILETIISRFQPYNCNEFWISTNYKSDLIDFYLKNFSEKNFNYKLFIEDKPLGTAGSISLLKNKISTTFFVTNCDILIDQDYSEILSYHKQNNFEITVVVSIKHISIPYGTVESGKNGELISLREKPDVSFKINCGMYILEPHLINEIPTDKFYHLTDLISTIKSRGGKVGVFPISEKSLIDLGDWDLYLNTLKNV